MQADEQRQHHIACAVLFVAVFCGMFFLSLWTPLIADDYNYAFGYANDTRISSLSDIWISMSWHRKLLNPRVFAHGWLSLVLMYPRWVFAALNGAISVFFSWTTIGFFRDQGSRNPIRAAACVWMLLWVCMPGYGQVFFWTAGACNYFWSLVLSWFILRSAIQLGQNRGKLNTRVCLLLLPTFVAGAWSEHISFAMLTAMFLILILRWKETGRFPCAEAVLLMVGCGGYLYLMLAPSAKLFQRLHDAGDPTERGNLTRILAALPQWFLPAALMCCVFLVLLILSLKRHRGSRMIATGFSGCIALLCGLTTLAAAMRALNSGGICEMISSTPVGLFLALTVYCTMLTVAVKKDTEKRQILFSLILAFSGICGFMLFLFGEYFPIRGFCAPVSFMVLAAVYLAETSACGRMVKTGKLAMVILSLWFSICFFLGTTDILGVHQAALRREADFAAAAAGDKRVTATPYPYRTKYSAQYGNPDLSPDADWPNGVVADYYGVIRIIVE